MSAFACVRVRTCCGRGLPSGPGRDSSASAPAVQAFSSLFLLFALFEADVSQVGQFHSTETRPSASELSAVATVGMGGVPRSEISHAAAAVALHVSVADITS